MKITILFFMLFVAVAVTAQTDHKRFINKVKEICPQADITEIEIKSGYVEIEYLCGDQLAEIGLGLNAEWMYTETKTEIPQDVWSKITKKLEKKYADWSVDEFALIEMADTLFYKVELIQDGVEENSYFALDGKYYHKKNMVTDENWAIAYLSQSANYKSAPYNFLKADKVYDMPDLLKEISGIAYADENTLYCIQDELGIVFKYDTHKEDISGMFRFTDVGDFEDLTVVKDEVFVLRSDGTLFLFNHRNFDGKIIQVVVPVNCMNVEGLEYNKADNQLYLACKDQLLNDQSQNRIVFRISADYPSKPGVALTILPDEINQMLAVKYPDNQNTSLQINPSAIAIHPQTSEKYVLSAASRLVAIYKNEKLINVFPLPAELYYKPEGIAFAPNGDLYLSSEGIKNGYVDGQIYLFTKK
ncbi:MAG: SdiA-regulated domain-containing protein [Bacteroidota bacterium]|nr:SdiA-regulated domain-containing protein [Bacteroidota bacterium]